MRPVVQVHLGPPLPPPDSGGGFSLLCRAIDNSFGPRGFSCRIGERAAAGFVRGDGTLVCSTGLPAIPAAPGPARRACSAEDEAEQPQHEDREGDVPQDVDREPCAAKDQRQQENRNDNAHLLSPFTHYNSSPQSEE